MKKLFIFLVCLCFVGCATLSYEAPDGTKVSYSRFLTGSDSIKGTLGTATIESQGQKAIDPASLQSILNILGTVVK